MKYFAVYDEAGVILRHGMCPDSTLELQGDLVVELPAEAPSDFDLGYYVLDGVVTQKPMFDLPDELTLVAGSSQDLVIPDPCQVTFEGEVHTVTGGVLGIDTETPATYEFLFEQWPYIPHTLKVIVQ